MKKKRSAGGRGKKVGVTILAVSVVIALVIGGCVLLLPVLRRGKTVAESPHFTWNAGMYSYYYYNALYAQLNGDFQPVYEYYGIDEKTDLASVEYENGKSWAAFFDESTRPRISAILSFAEAATDEEMSLSEEEKQAVETAVKRETDQARAAGKSTGSYLSERYGKGVTEEDIRTVETILALANHRAEALQKEMTVEDTAIEQYAEEHSDDLLQADFLYYVLDAPDGSGMSEEELAKAKAENFSRAEELAAITTTDGYSEWVKQRETVLAKEKGEELTDADWEEIKKDFTYLQTDWSYASVVDASMKTRTAGERFLTPDESTGSCGVVFVITPPHRAENWETTVRETLLAAAYKEAEAALTGKYADQVTLRENTLSLLLERTVSQ